MRLRKNLRIWTMVLVVCFCLFAVVSVGAMVEPKLAYSQKEEKPSETTEPPADVSSDKEQVKGDIGKVVQNASLAQRLIEGYTADVDQSVFEGTAIIGNSFVDDVKSFGLIKDADFYSASELNVRNVKDFVSPQTSMPIYQSLSVKKNKNIVFVFGHNEMGWNIETFESLFQEMIISTADSSPGSRLFISAVIPVSKEISDGAVDGSTMERVNLANECLVRLSTENGATFVDSTALFAGPDGYLAPGTSSDGVSLEYKYCKAWANYLAENIKKINS